MKIPGFTIKERIGEGELSETWKAHQISLDRTVALRILKAETAASQKHVGGFVSDARAIAKLKHPHIVQVYDVGQHNDCFYMVHEYLEGQTLADVVKEQKTFKSKQALDIAAMIAEALQYAWDAGRITHRYLRPDCIWVDGDGLIKIADIGISKPVDRNRLLIKLQSGRVDVTASYLAPEQAMCHAKPGPATDMYALGAVLYHLVTGRAPFEDCPPSEVLDQQKEGTIPHPSDINPAFSRAVAQWIAILMMKDPAHRPEDWSSVVKTISAFQRKKALRPLSIPASHKSTIARSRKTTIHPKKAAHPDASSAHDTAPSERIPLIAHVIVWALLLTVWSLWAYVRMDPPPPKPVPMARRRPSRPSPVPAPHAHPTTHPPAQPSPAPLPTPSPSERAPVVIDAPDDPEDVIDSEADTLRTQIASLLIDERYEDAKRMIASERQYIQTLEVTKALDQLEPYINELSTINTVIASRFEERLNTTVMIKHKDQRKRIRVTGVEGGVVVGVTPGRINNLTVETPIRVTIAALSVEERNHWLGRPTSPITFAMKYILYMRQGNFGAALGIAANCGLLAPEFTQIARIRK